MRKKILIVDDDSRNIFALAAVLKAKGYDCVSTDSARQAMAFLADGSEIGIVLMDMMMPEMDGYEAIPQIVKKYEIPVIAVTAQAMQGDKEKCLQAGAMDYLSKPIDVDTLLIILNRYLVHNG